MANSLEKTISLLNQTTDAAMRAKVTLDSLVTQMMKNPSQTVQLNYADGLRRIMALEEQRVALIKEANALMAASKPPVAATTSNYVAGGATTGAATAENTAAFNALTGGGTPTAKEVRAKQLAARQAAIKAAEAERQAYIKSEANAKEMAEMAKLGYTDPQSQFKYNRNVPGGAYSVSRWQRTDPDSGKQYRTDARIDPRGNIAQGAIPKQNQSFTQGISKDIGDLLKWSVAISAIYGPLNAMSEAMTQLIENESKLADVSIFLTDGLANTEKVFDDVYRAAQGSGESVAGVIDAFGAAYTAAGRITNEIDRYNSTLKLLDDSLTLSKLSTLDQAGAIDVLTAALYQTAKAHKIGEAIDPAQALGIGTDLIDQWVQVSKVASVSVETLATGVAVLGDSAETAGLSIEQMNAMIATLSEVSLSSGKETANIAKALIGNYQQESAVKELNRLGIAVVDTTGKTRQFLDVMKDVAALRSNGILQDPDFNRLTLALGGGGIRRQKDVSAFIENFSRMEQLTKIQEAGAGGQSEQAMAKKLDTVQTSATQLQNAFVSLAQTMGTEGGLLDVFSGAARGATSLIEGLDGVASAVGKVGPLLIAFGVGSLLLRGKGGAAGLANSMMNNFGMSHDWAGSLTGQLNPIEAALGRQTGPGGMAGSFGSGRMGSAFSRATTLPSLAAIALPAAQNFSSGDTAEGWANVAGGTLGALLAGPVGALAGSAIAEAFVRTTMTYDKSFVDLFAGKVTPGDSGAGTATGEKSLEELLSGMYKELGSGNEAVGGFRGWWEDFKTRQVAIGTNPDGSKTNNFRATGSYGSEEAAAYELYKKQNPEGAAALRARMAAEGILPEGYKTRQTKEQLALSTPGQLKTLGTMQQSESDRLKLGVISGDIKQSDYANRLASLSAFSTTATGWMAAVTDESGKLNDSFKSNEDAWNSFLLIMGSGNQEAIKNINSIVAEMTTLQDIIDNWDGSAPITFTLAGQEYTTQDKKVAENAYATGQTVLGSTFKVAEDYARNQNMGVRDVYGGNTATTSGKDIATVTQDAIRLQEQYYSNLSKDDYEAKKDSFDKFYVWVEDAGKTFYKEIVDASGRPLDKAIFGEAFQAAQADGRISKQDSSGMDWQVQSFTAAQIRDAESRAPAYVAQLEQVSGGQYQSEVTDVIMSTSDKQLITAHGDQKVIQYLLQQILDTEKKSLANGVYNLPEGANIMVPFQGYQYGYDTSGPGTVTTDSSSNGSTSKSVGDLIREAAGTNFNPDEYIGNLFDTKTKKPEMSAKELWDKGEQYSWIGSKNRMGSDGSSGPRPEQDTGSVLEQILSKFMSLFTPGSGMLAGFSGVGQGIGSGSIGSGSGFIGGKGRPTDSSQAVTQTKMDIRFTSTTNLMVDGRVLASIVKPYLAADLLKTNESGGTITRSMVI
jgi:TP901 family phage tail tape measure protein